MADVCYVTNSQDGITLTAYRGDGAALLAFDLDQQRTPHLAGFTRQVTPPDGQSSYVLNRLSFSQPITSATTADQRVWTPGDRAPALQKFCWLDFPGNLVPGSYAYAVTAICFSSRNTAEAWGRSFTTSLWSSTSTARIPGSSAAVQRPPRHRVSTV